MPEGAPTDEIEDLLERLRDSSWSRKADALRATTAKLASGTLGREAEQLLGTSIIEASTDPKWEVRKGVALAVAELRYLSGEIAQQTLDGLSNDSNHWVSQAAARAIVRRRSRAHRANEWALTEDTQNPTLQYIAGRIRKIGLRSMTPASIHNLAMEVGEQFYRELAADTAHEIRTLLTPFEGYFTELGRHLDASGTADEKTEYYLAATQARLQQIQMLVDNLHIYSSSAEADFVPVELDIVVRDAISIGSEPVLQDENPVSIKSHVELPNGLIIDGLQERLTRAVANLVSNACQAMPEGGTLTVKGKLAGSGLVELTISDTGHGMTTDMIDQAMERFHTTRRNEGGTGLGLPIAQRIIEHDHGGELSIYSEPNEGSQVIITLPVQHKSEEV